MRFMRWGDDMRDISGLNTLHELSLIEKFLMLLTYDGELKEPRGAVMEYGIAGGTLMELEKQGYLDSDLNDIIPLVVKSPPDPLFAKVHREVFRKGSLRTKEWLDWLAREQAAELYNAALTRLLQRGFLVKRARKKMWVFTENHIEAVNGAGAVLRAHVLNTLLAPEIPLPDDIRLIILADATGMLRQMFSDEERRRTMDKLELVRRHDLVGQVMAVAIEDIDLTVSISVEPR